MTRVDITLMELKKILDKLRMLRGQGTPGLDADIQHLEQMYELNRREADAINRMRQSIKYAKNVSMKQGEDWSQYNMAEQTPMSTPEIGVAPMAGMPRAQHAKRKKKRITKRRKR
jgi:hypothetical protein